MTYIVWSLESGETATCRNIALVKKLLNVSQETIKDAIETGSSIKGYCIDVKEE